MIKAVLYSLVFVAIVAGCIWQRGAIRHAYHLATSHQPETYTELYFANVTKLPGQVTAGKTYTYTVHVTNHQAKTVRYRVVATVAISHAATTVTQATITLRDGQGADKEFTLNMPKTQESAVITVSLPDQGQHIEFKSKS
jgi:uncharacterized membrane protein